MSEKLCKILTCTKCDFKIIIKDDFFEYINIIDLKYEFCSNRDQALWVCDCGENNKSYELAEAICDLRSHILREAHKKAEKIKGDMLGSNWTGAEIEEFDKKFNDMFYSRVMAKSRLNNLTEAGMSKCIYSDTESVCTLWNEEQPTDMVHCNGWDGKCTDIAYASEHCPSYKPDDDNLTEV